MTAPKVEMLQEEELDKGLLEGISFLIFQLLPTSLQPPVLHNMLDCRHWDCTDESGGLVFYCPYVWGERGVVFLMKKTPPASSWPEGPSIRNEGPGLTQQLTFQQ